MKRLYCGDIETLAEFMVNCASEKKTAVAAMFYDKAKELLREIVRYDEVDISLIEIEPVDLDGYEKEYYITVSGEFGLEVYVDKAMNRSRGEYLGIEADYLILDSGASNKIINANYTGDAVVYEAVFKADADVKCQDCDLCIYDCSEETSTDSEKEEDDNEINVKITIDSDEDDEAILNTLIKEVDRLFDLLW